MSDATSPHPKEGRRALFFNLGALLCGVWFLLTGWMWPYLANLVFSYPVALVGIVLWYFGRKIDPGSRLNNAAIALLVVGFVCSVVAIFLFR